MSDTNGDGKHNQKDDASMDNAKPENYVGTPEALSVEDYPKLSAAMRNLMASLKNPTVEEVFVSILYVIVVETGFVPFGSERVDGDDTCRYNARRLKSLEIAAKSWTDKNGVYLTHLVLAPFPQEMCKFVCIPVGNYLAANMYSGLSRKNAAEFFNPRDYVALYPNGRIELKKMKELAHRFKNNVAVPMRTALSNELSQASVGLFALPVEVLLKIISYLKDDDFLKWSSTCKYFYETFAFDEQIWKRFCFKKFGGFNPESAQTHREYYKSKVVFRNKWAWNNNRLHYSNNNLQNNNAMF